MWSVQAATAACSPGEVHLRGDWGQARFTVELADDADERAQGLMHREFLARSAGMLFVYNAPAELTFWMRNTLIELDMIFADELGRVTHIHSRAQPLDETLIPSKGPALAVLEINGGLAEAMGLDVGSEMRHPAFDQSRAAWPCSR
ncbi:DUF192 domain-containing protein [Rhodobacteraceae bacterium 63075]|nr:DUF192 domain-containing protein [Rhodobacteraceae bacterium 63075]